MKIELKKRLYYFLLGMLGFAAACDDNNNEMRVEYGSPYINAKMSGRVTDKNNNPIKGIQVQYGRLGYSLQQTFTADDGSYEVSKERVGYYTHDLVFTDIDGVENGGEFVEQSVEVKFTEADRTGNDKGGGSWYYGSFERTDINVEMEETGEQ